MRRIVLFGLALIAAVPAPAIALAGTGPQAAAAPAAEALALARLMSPRDLLVDMEVREFDKHFVSSLGADPDMKSLDDKYPGLFEAMHKSSRILVAEAMARSVDQIQISVAKLIETSFTAADIIELNDFYRSPTGQKTIQQMAASADASQIYQRAVEEQEFHLTEEQIASQVRANAQKAAETFTPEEQTQMLLFMAKPSFAKLAKAQPQIRKILADEFNAPDAAFDKQIEEAMAAAIERHIASFDKTDGK